MGKSKNKNFKKNEAEIRSYHNFIKSSSYSPDNTIPIKNEFLQGSADWASQNSELKTSDKIRKTPLKYRFSDWFKDHLFPAIISAIVLGVGAWVLSHQVDLAVVNEQISYIEEQIDDLKNDSVEKEVLEVQLKNIKSEIDSIYSLTLNDIKWELDNLEKELEDIAKD